MSTEMVAQDNRKIVATRLPYKNPQWAFNNESWDTLLPAQVIKIDNGNIAYSLYDFEARATLAMHMQYAIDSVFEMIPQYHRDGEVYYQKDYLMEAAGLLAKDSNVTLLARCAEIQHKLDAFFELLHKVYMFSQNPDAMFADYRVGKAVRKYVKSLNELTNRKATVDEQTLVSRMDQYVPEWLHLRAANCDPTLRTFLASREFQPENGDEATPTQKEIEEEKTREEWLLSLSPDLLAEYQKTEEEFDEVSPLVTTPEDEYFIEQVKGEYYPSIFESLRNLNESTDFSYKETVVVESIKQFKIIQLGLQRIMDSIVAARLSSIRSQTDFLMNKVLGPNAITLTPDERDEKLEATLEEAQRIREELYKKHVAPVLEQNRLEYEERLTQERQTLEAKHETAWNKREQEYATARDKREQENKAAWKEREESHAARVAELEGKLAKARIEWKRLNSLNKEITKNYEEQISDLDSEITTLETRILYTNSTHKTAITNYYEHVQHLQSEISQLQAVVMDYIDRYESDKSLPQVKQEVVEKSQKDSALPSQWHEAAETAEEAGEFRNLAKIQRDTIALRQNARKRPKLEDDDYDSETPQLVDTHEWKEILKGEFSASAELLNKHDEAIKMNELMLKRNELLLDEILTLQESLEEDSM